MTEKNSNVSLRIGLLGLGVVGGGVCEILHRHRAMIADRAGVTLKVVRACVRDIKKKRQGPAGRVPTVIDPMEIVAADDVDVVVELMGGITPAKDLVVAALKNGKSVVTANKAILAAHGSRIFSAAEQSRADIFFEAAVAGGIPIIRTLREGLASDRITKIAGILNGTTNFVLGKMEEGSDYQGAVRRAQELGFAEADPTLDVNGRDAADKLSILSQIAFGIRAKPKQFHVQGIDTMTPEVIKEAAQMGYRVKLVAIGQRLGRGKNQQIDMRVHPCWIPEHSPLAAVSGAYNAVGVVSDALGMTLYQGPGAGALPTGSAVVADLIEAARSHYAGIHGRVGLAGATDGPALLPKGQSQSAFYVRLSVADSPGVLAGITQAFAKQGVSIATVVQQKGEGARAKVPISLTTHPASHDAVAQALAVLRKQKAVGRETTLMHMGDPLEAA